MAFLPLVLVVLYVFLGDVMGVSLLGVGGGASLLREPLSSCSVVVASVHLVVTLWSRSSLGGGGGVRWSLSLRGGVVRSPPASGGGGGLSSCGCIFVDNGYCVYFFW